MVTAKVELIDNNFSTIISNNNNNNIGPNKNIIGNIKTFYIRIFGQKSPKKK